MEQREYFFKDGISEVETKAIKNIANDSENFYNDNLDNQKVLDGIISDKLEHGNTKVLQTIEKFTDTIDALEGQLNYHDEKLGELAEQIQTLTAKEMELNYKAIVPKGQQVENMENLVEQMNKIRDQLDPLEEKYEKMLTKTERIGKIVQDKIYTLHELLSNSYDTPRSFDPEEESPNKKYLNN
ncbi:MAG: hypothetical protein RL641_812 [Candidatus Parcubacteria bacterium]|jgi:methyl-accepting chemotaxis protein